MGKNETAIYSGPERRTYPVSDRRQNCQNCLDHSGLIERMNNIENRTDHLENEEFLTSRSFRWIIGILVSIHVAVLSATLYVSFESNQALRDVKSSQTTLSLQISYIHKEIEGLKRKMTTK